MIKSKREEFEWRIGRLSRGMHGGSPKGARKSGGMDVEAEERRAEVQKKKICTWKQPLGRRLFPQIEVIS